MPSQAVWYVHSFPPPRHANLTDPVQYSIGHLHGAHFHGDKLRELEDPTPCRDEIIPDPDSIPVDILNHPLGNKHEIDFAAYDPPEITLSPTDGGDPMSVFYLDHPFEMLIGEQARGVLRIHIRTRKTHGSYDQVHL